MGKFKLVVTICSSINFYRQAVDIQELLQNSGFDAIIPETAERMKKLDDYEVSRFKPTLDESLRKAELMRGHFKEVEKGDVCLVLNYEKHGVKNYIGGNVLIEMALAFYLNKPILIFNEVPDHSAFLEEINGMQPIVLHGDQKQLIKELEKINAA